MTISVSGAGAVLYFSYQELHAHPAFSGTLTRETAHALVHAALAASAQPIPSSMEVSCFPAHHGVLLFAFPSMPFRPFSARNFS